MWAGAIEVAFSFYCCFCVLLCNSHHIWSVEMSEPGILAKITNLKHEFSELSKMCNFHFFFSDRISVLSHVDNESFTNMKLFAGFEWATPTRVCAKWKNNKEKIASIKKRTKKNTENEKPEIQWSMYAIGRKISRFKWL